MADPLAPWLDRLPGPPVAVLGHPVLDQYLFGVTHRISREAPVLIVREESRTASLGGAANTAANLAGLGAEARLVGPLGKDAEGDLLIGLCAEAGIRSEGLVRGASPVTLTKTRVLAGGLHTTRQQMLRIDRESDVPTSSASIDALLEAAGRAISSAGAIVVSDYGDGTLGEVWREAARRARAAGLPVVVDSRHALLRFEGVTAVTPNEPEAEIALGRSIRTAAEAERAACELRDRLGLEAALLTRGREGMVLAPREGPPRHVPAVGGEAVDVTGAGDTVAATFTLALAAGAPVLVAARLANLAASVVVQRTGTAPIDLASLEAALATHGEVA